MSVPFYEFPDAVGSGSGKRPRPSPALPSRRPQVACPGTSLAGTGRGFWSRLSCCRGGLAPEAAAVAWLAASRPEFGESISRGSAPAQSSEHLCGGRTEAGGGRAIEPEDPRSILHAMNCRSEVLEVSVEGRQVEEAMLAVLHTVLLHRSTGKFHYKKEGTYSIGTVGTQDVDCDFIDFTYVRVSSEELDRALRKVVGEFKDALRNSGGDGLGQMSLEFYQKKKSRWPFSDECIPWEVWTVKVHVVALATEQERQICREKVGEKLCEKIINIVEVMNRHEYLPKMPTQSEVDNVFDTGLRDVQPYLYKISFQITDALGTSVTTTMRRLIKDTLAL